MITGRFNFKVLKAGKVTVTESYPAYDYLLEDNLHFVSIWLKPYFDATRNYRVSILLV